MGRKPINEKAMTNAERQKRYRAKHPRKRIREYSHGEQFRFKLFDVIRWYGRFLSMDEVQETLESFGWAWVYECLRHDTRYLKYDQVFGRYIADVYYGNNNCGGKLGDEERYKREREVERKHSEEADAEMERQLAALRAEGYDQKSATVVLLGRQLKLLAA